MSENETFLTCLLSCVLGLSQMLPSLFKSREIHNFIQACCFSLQAKTTLCGRETTNVTKCYANKTLTYCLNHEHFCLSHVT